MNSITLRNSIDDDEVFVNELTRLVMREYVEKTWSEKYEQELYYEINAFNQQNTKIIQYNGIDIGRVSITKKNELIKLDEIHIIPSYQGKKIGTTIIKSLLKEAAVPVELAVLLHNPAKKLYKRLGFKQYYKDPYRLKMRFEPVDIINGLLPAVDYERDTDFNHFVKKMEMYIAAMKTILQLSAASLAASIVFIEKFQEANFSYISISLQLTWLLMGISIISAALYQYLSVKCIEFRFNLGFTINKFKFIRFLIKNPGIVFGIALGSFLLGTLCFVVFVIGNI